MEFLLRVATGADGGFRATCQPVETEPVKEWLAADITGAECEGRGATALAAMVAALVNSRAGGGE